MTTRTTGATATRTTGATATRTTSATTTSSQGGQGVAVGTITSGTVYNVNKLRCTRNV